MNGAAIVFCGFFGTIVLTTLMAGSQGLGLTRMGIPFMLGTIFTGNRDHAKIVGFALHLVNGWLLASIYAAAFQLFENARWWLGPAIGLVHAIFVLVVLLPMMPAIHPRMADEQRGPTPTRLLEPPGFPGSITVGEPRSSSSSPTLSTAQFWAPSISRSESPPGSPALELSGGRGKAGPLPIHSGHGRGRSQITRRGR